MLDLNEMFPLPSNELAIRRDDMPDDPVSLRWRAWWDRSYDRTVRGIEAKCYPVVRTTPKGAWIDPHAYRNGDEWSQPYKELLRWVSNDGGQAWAKPTQADALNSLVERYRRWASRIGGDIDYFVQASEALKVLMPDREWIAKYGLGEIAGRLEGIKR